jgi:hypothetical protein
MSRSEVSGLAFQNGLLAGSARRVTVIDLENDEKREASPFSLSPTVPFLTASLNFDK